MSSNRISPPYIHHWNTAKLNERILLSILSLVIIWAVVMHGTIVLAIMFASILGSAFAVLVIRLVFRSKLTLSGFAVWSLLIASVFPFSIPLYIPFCTGFITIFCFGAFLGGRENNSYNVPAFGALFAYTAWPYAMAGYAISGSGRGIDAISASTPIQKLTESVASNLLQKDGFSVLQELGFNISRTDKSITDYLNTVFFNDLKSNLPYGFFDFLFGVRSSTIIESGLFIIVIGTLVLVALGYYKYIASFSATFALFALVLIFGLGLPGEDIFRGNVLLAAVNHGILPALLIFSIFPENSCISRLGQLLFGVLMGGVSYFILFFKAGSAGMFLSISVANIFMILLKNRNLRNKYSRGSADEE